MTAGEPCTSTDLTPTALIPEFPALAAARQPAILRDIERLISIETPSSDPDAVAAGARLVSELIEERLGVTPETVVIDGCAHLRLRFGAADPAVVLLTHQDTVWPGGTLARLPFSAEGGVLRGPGSFDMKTGLAMSIHALALIANRAGRRALDGVSLLVTGDEELGSPSSSELILAEARAARAVFVTEASAEGKLKTARKGTSNYVVEVTGLAAHAGLEPEKGIHAGLELARQILAIAALSAPALGTTVTPTAFSGGTTRNTVPAHARLDVDVRATTAAELERVDAAMRSLTPGVPGAEIRLGGGINRPPMEASMSERLYGRAVQLSERMGQPAPGQIAVGGASDGNFTAGAGIPTLDGLGAVGDGAHAEHEHALIDALAPRTALLAALVFDRLAAAGRGLPAPRVDR